MTDLADALRALDELNQAATPGDWAWFSEHRARDEDEFLEWAREVYRHTKDPQPEIHFLGVQTDGLCHVAAETGCGLTSSANAQFILACVIFVRGLLDRAREKGEL